MRKYFCSFHTKLFYITWLSWTKKFNYSIWFKKREKYSETEKEKRQRFQAVGFEILAKNWFIQNWKRNVGWGFKTSTPLEVFGLL